MSWMSQIRRRALWVVVCMGVTALGVIAWTTIPAWPVVGVAVATVAILINSITARISTSSCLSCGLDLSSQPTGVHGRICPGCGAVNERNAAEFMALHHTPAPGDERPGDEPPAEDEA